MASGYYTTKTKCTNVDSFCASYTTGEEYKCPGHTNKVSSSSSPKYNGITPTFSTYASCSGTATPTTANIVKAIDINTLRDILQAEINMRKKHALYKSASIDSAGSAIQAQTLVEASQQNQVFKILAQLADAINRVNAAAGDGTKTVPNASKKVSIGDTIKAADLKDLETLLTPILNDCICYSDCTDHKTTAKRVWISTCGCHGQCGCVYW